MMDLIIIDIFFRALKEEITNMQTKEMESNGKKSEIEKQLEVVESEKSSLKNQLKLAQTRIESLQKALKGEDSEEEEEEMASFMEHHRRAMSVTREGRRSMTREKNHQKADRSRVDGDCKEGDWKSNISCIAAFI